MRNGLSVEYRRAFAHAWGVSMVTQKTNILRSVGYFELPKREMWVDRDGRKAFSRQALRDHDVAWVYDRLQDRVPAGSFYFYFNHPDGKGVACREILAEIGLSALQAEMPLVIVRTVARVN